MPSTVAILLGPYRNLSTLTAALLHLHPAVQALNHAGWRVLGHPEIDFFLKPHPEALARFVEFALQASTGGRPGDYGGSILLSHAFHSDLLKDTYVNRFGDRFIKDRVDCLVWKESLRIDAHLRKHAVDIGELLSQLPTVRFVLPVRHPLDTAQSNLRTGHWSLFPQFAAYRNPPDGTPTGKRAVPSCEQVLRAVLEEIRWFAELERLHSEHCFHFFQPHLDRECLDSLARFLALAPEERWLDDAEKCSRVKTAGVHPPALVRVYTQLVAGLFSEHPAYREELLRFVELDVRG